MNVHEYLEKIATSQFVAAQPKADPLGIRMDTRSPIGPFKPGTRPVPNTLRNYMKVLSKKTADPTVGSLAKTQLGSLQNITKTNPQLKSGLRVNNRIARKGSALLRLDSSGAQVASKNVNPLTLSHEVAHADDFSKRKGLNLKNPDASNVDREYMRRIQTIGEGMDRQVERAKKKSGLSGKLRRGVGPTFLGKKMGIDYKPLPYSTKRRPSEDNSNLVSKKLRKLQRAGMNRDKVVDEVQANRKTLESYAPWKNRKTTPMSAAEKRTVGEILANQTTYYESKTKFSKRIIGGEEFEVARPSPTKGSKNQLKATPEAAKLKMLQEKRKNLVTRFKMADAVGNSAKAGRFQSAIDRIQKLESRVKKSTNPFEGRRFREKGSWEQMPKARRKSYIQQILKNEKRIASDFGADQAKLYKSEMMRALRKTLRR